MTSMAEAVIDCSSISASDITITGDGAGAYQFTDDGLGDPDITWRLTAAPDSANVHGTEYTGAAKEQTALPWRVLVTASSSSALADAVDALTDALSQFTYPTTVTVDGVGRVWSCSPAAWSCGPVQWGMVTQFIKVMVITIPVYPIPGPVEES